MCCDPALPLLPTAIESRSGTGTLPQACGLNRSRTSTHIPIPRTVSADRLLIFSLSENRRGTIFRSSAPPKPRLPAGQMRSPVSFFHNLSQVPVDLAAHIRYTGLAFFGSFSHIHFKRKRRTGQPFLAALFVFFTFFLQRALLPYYCTSYQLFGIRLLSIGHQFSQMKFLKGSLFKFA